MILIPNLFTLQALYGDLGGFSAKKKQTLKPSGLYRGEAKKERLKGESRK